MSRRLTLAALVALLLILAAGLEAQIIFGDPARVQGRLVLQNWKLTYSNSAVEPETTLTQTAVPVYAFVPIKDNWEIHINASASHSSFDGGDGGNSLSSLSMPMARVYRSFSEDRLFVSAGVILPLGETELDSVGLVISELVSGDYLSTPVKQLGGGLGAIFQIGGADQYEQLLFGGSVSYYLTGSYTYSKNGLEYDPGDEVAFQGSVTLPAAPGHLDLDLGYRYFVSDKIESEEVFKNGDQFSLSLSGSYDFGATTAQLGLLHLLRGKDSRRNGEVFSYEPFNSNGNKTVVSGSVTQDLRPDLEASVLFAYRVLSSNDWEEGQPLYFGKSDLFSIGADLGYAGADGRYSLFGRLLFSNGSANSDFISISGVEFSLGGRVIIP